MVIGFIDENSGHQTCLAIAHSKKKVFYIPILYIHNCMCIFVKQVSQNILRHAHIFFPPFLPFHINVDLDPVIDVTIH